MIQTPRQLAIAAVAALVLSAGCGGGAPEPEGGSQASPAATAPAASSGAPRNACTLVDRAELEAIAVQQLDMLNNIESDDETVCELSNPSDHTVLVYVTVHWRGGKELARVNSAATGIARQMLNENDVDIEKLTGSGDVPGLADKAYYSNVMPSWVLKGDVLIEVISPRFGGDQTKAVFLAVAKTALSRL